MSFQRSKKSPKSPRRSPAKSTMGLSRTQPVVTTAVGGGSLSVTEKEFIEKGKQTMTSLLSTNYETPKYIICNLYKKELKLLRDFWFEPFSLIAVTNHYPLCRSVVP